MIRVGIDVGGTNTDAVVMRGREVLFGLKTATTADVMSGVVDALKEVVAGAAIESANIGAVMIGTTHFTNALVERRHLAPVGMIRLGLPATSGLPPTSAWPEDMLDAVPMHWRLAQGGYEFDGRELATMQPEQIHGFAQEFAALGLRDVAIAGAFSFINDAQEHTAAALVRAVMPDARITLSSQIGRIGLLERENAAILNACLGPLGLDVVAAFEQALKDSGINAPFYLTQNDGTLMSAKQAASFPILTVASGPTNSMRGAAFLSGLADAIVVDIGGTTSDVGVLQAGFPRQAGIAVEVGGVRTNFRMPDVYSIGLGGGSLVNADQTTFGPRSVGYNIHTEALVFGGRTLTATDIAVAAGVATLGDAGRVAHLAADAVQRCHARLQQMVFDAVERMRTSAVVLPVVVVGGGSILLREHVGEALVTIPPHFGVANAVGAAMAQVSGESDRVLRLDEGMTREQAIARVRADAELTAVQAGANPQTLTLLDVEDVPLAYIGGNATRIRVRVIGDLNETGTATGTTA
ncbi:hydantoinase/oxoprolinase family protein [Paucibacter sp. DJ2R-2]|uniref:hydantoinase/oxoprolinase family protein n=1 Tax=Paucibacter sp. DJ2R-2 TaxID=2893558 RepID=UPI0021E39F0D|nr:hydantoinase/oxoprolinase family protein [Paucibacter sp. DJ2R-2]MCV2438602.1 hydantoinase/oxoprolinase family protein [Paucibacter sp. DJ2R-2]